MKRKNQFARELFLLFYMLFFCATFLYKLSQASIIYYILCAAQFVYIPGMLFAAGYQINALYNTYSDKEDFQRIVLKKAFSWLAHFYIIGSLKLILLDHRFPFLVFKELLALIKIPGLAAIFITLCFLYIAAAFFWKPLMDCKCKKWVIPLISIIGLLFTFLPAKLIGYGLVGIFTGGDNLGAVPIFPYLFFLFIGCYYGQEDNFQFSNKKSLFYAILILVFGGGFIMLRMKTPALTLLGSFLAGIGVIFCHILAPIYNKLETSLYEKLQNLWKKLFAFYTKKSQKASWSGFFYLMGYSILFVVVSVFIFLPYIQEHRTLIWSVDGLGQYVPKIYRFMEYIPSIIKDVLHGNMNFKQYDFTSGLGSTVAISFDPIYWLYLLFNPGQAETVYSLMVVLRFFLAGLSFSALALYFKKSHFSAYTASMVYAFSGYAIYAGTKHAQFITPLILLPMLVIAMEKLIREMKWYMMTVFVAISLLCSYYFLYMNTIAIGIYFILRILCDKDYRNLKTFFSRGFTIVGSYILGSCIGIISIFTQFASYMGSSRTEGGSLDSFLSTTSLFYRTEWIPDAFISFISDSFTPGMWLKLGFAPIALLAVVLIFTRKAKKELRIMFVIGSLFCIFPICGYIFSGFSSVNNRWCYIYTCLVAFILAEVFDFLPKLTGREFKIMAGITFLYGGIAFFSPKFQTQFVMGALAMLAMTLVILFMINQSPCLFPKSWIKPLIFCVTVITIILNANLFMTAGKHMTTYVKKGTAMKAVKSNALKYLDEVETEDEEFHRSTNLRTSGNSRSSSLLMGYNDLSTFTSTLGSSIVDYNSAMGNCDWNIVSVYSYNTRTIMNELASVKYIGYSAKNSAACIPYGYEMVLEKKTKTNTEWIYENKYALPLGYTYDNILSSKDASSYSAAEKQDLTMMTAIVDEKTFADNSNIDQTKKLSLSAHKLEITGMDLKGVTMDEKEGILEVKKGSSMTIHFQGEANAESYLAFDGDIYHAKDAKEHFLKTTITSEGSKFLYKFRIDSYSTGQDEFLFHLGYHENAIDSCTLTFLSDGTLQFDEIAVYSQPMDNYADQVAALQENVLENVKTADNFVSGDITLDKDKMLCISLPYQTGWTAYVDGKETKIQRVNYQYMGLNLTPGSHHIELRYQLPGIKYAFLITIAGLGTFLLIIIFNVVRKRLKNTKK